jgi:hypothetical protein
MPRPLYARGRDPVPLVQGAGRVYVSILMGVENPALHWATIPDHSSPQRVSIPTELSRPPARTRNPQFVSGRKFIAYLLPLNLSQLISLQILA